MSEDLNSEELVDNLDCSNVTFTQKTERDSSGAITCSLSFSIADPRYDPFVIDEDINKDSKEIEFKITKQKSDRNGADLVKVSIGRTEINEDNHQESANKLVQKMKDSSISKTEEGMGNVLATACIVTEQTQPSFSSRIGYEEVFEECVLYKVEELIKIKEKLSPEMQLEINSSSPNSTLRLQSSFIISREDIDWKQLKEEGRKYKKSYKKINEVNTLEKDISNAVKEAKRQEKKIATIMVSCRYSSSGTSDDGHTICIAVNTDKFDNNGKLLEDSQGNPKRLMLEDCAIIDSSRAIIDYDIYHTQRDYGIKEIYSQLNQLIDVSNIKAYSLYPKSIQVGPKCSDYARRAYQKLSSEYYTDIVDLKNRSFEFANSIHESVQRDYERVFKGNVPMDIIDKLSEKRPKEDDYPKIAPSPSEPKKERIVPLASKSFEKHQPPNGSSFTKKRSSGTSKLQTEVEYTKKQVKEQVIIEKPSQPSVEGSAEKQAYVRQIMQTSPLNFNNNREKQSTVKNNNNTKKTEKPSFNPHVKPHEANPNVYTGNQVILHNLHPIVKPKVSKKTSFYPR